MSWICPLVCSVIPYLLLKNEKFIFYEKGLWGNNYPNKKRLRGVWYMHLKIKNMYKNTCEWKVYENMYNII